MRYCLSNVIAAVPTSQLNDKGTANSLQQDIGRTLKNHSSPVYGVTYLYSEGSTGSSDEAEVYAALHGRYVLLLRVNVKFRKGRQNATLLTAYEDAHEGECYYACDYALGALAFCGLLGKVVFRCLASPTDNENDAPKEPPPSQAAVFLHGHGQAINDVCFVRRKCTARSTYYILSGSKDYSIRLWCVSRGQQDQTNYSGVCLAIFGGDRGHRDEVLTLDVHPTRDVFLSGGMDSALKLWALPSHLFIQRERPKSAPQYSQYPLYSTIRVHRNYVDCARFISTAAMASASSLPKPLFLIASKSIHECVHLWAPEFETPVRQYLLCAEAADAEVVTEVLMESENTRPRNSRKKKQASAEPDREIPGQRALMDGISHLLLDVDSPGTSIWYMKLTVFWLQEVEENRQPSLQPFIAVGNQKGNIHILALAKGTVPPQESSKALASKSLPAAETLLVQEHFGLAHGEPLVTLSHPLCTRPIRQVAVSPVQARLLVAGCDDGKIYIWRRLL